MPHYPTDSFNNKNTLFANASVPISQRQLPTYSKSSSLRLSNNGGNWLITAKPNSIITDITSPSLNGETVGSSANLSFQWGEIQNDVMIVVDKTSVSIIIEWLYQGLSQGEEQLITATDAVLSVSRSITFDAINITIDGTLEVNNKIQIFGKVVVG